MFGATGATGRLVVEQALQGGHDVTAVARHPEKLAPHPHLATYVGDVLDLASLRESCRDAEAAVSCIGPASNLHPGTVMSVGTANMVAAAEEAGVRRFVFQSGIGLSDGSELSSVDRCVLASLWRPMFKAAIGDKAEGERLLRASALEWVIVRPTVLRNAPATGQYVAAQHARVGLLSALSFADCAACLLRAVDEPAWTRQTINLGRG